MQNQSANLIVKKKIYITTSHLDCRMWTPWAPPPLLFQKFWLGRRSTSPALQSQSATLIVNPPPFALALGLQTSSTFDQQTVGSCKIRSLDRQINFSGKNSINLFTPLIVSILSLAQSLDLILMQCNATNTIQMCIWAIKSTTALLNFLTMCLKFLFLYCTYCVSYFSFCISNSHYSH